MKNKLSRRTENMEIDDENVKALLESYAEKVADGQTQMAFGIRYAMKRLGIVTDEQIQEVLDPAAAKVRKAKERKQIREMLEPNENGEEKPKRQGKKRRK